MSNPTVSSSGDGDEVFIQRLREFMEDIPLFSPEQVTANGTSTEYRLSQFPVFDNDEFATVIASGTTQTIVDSRRDLTAANQVAFDYETGWSFWNPGFPPNGTIIFRKSKVRWRNERMLEVLYAGLKAMFPMVWQDQFDTSITMQVNQWEYTLPSIFSDPRVRILGCEIREIPANLEQFYKVTWERKTLLTVSIPTSQDFIPGSTLRIRYAGPYQTLADLETQVQQLPLLYAKGMLLSNKELVRARQDTANVTQAENANPPGTSQNAGAYFINLFEQELQRLARPMPQAPIVSVYGR